MKLAVLFSGGKDSTLSAQLVKNQGHEISCLISIISKNKDSYMFHTPSISKVIKQSEVMGIPIVIQETEGKKEEELKDLKKAIKKALIEYDFEGIVTGAVQSDYQSSRIKKICDEFELKCLNPLWNKPPFELINEIIKNKFEVIITGVFAYPLDDKWIGRKIDFEFLKDVKELNKKYRVSPIGEGGEFESFVLNCPLFKRGLKIKNKQVMKEGDYSWRMELDVE